MLSRVRQDRRTVEIIVPEKLLTRLDDKLRNEGVYRSRSELIVRLLREYVGAE